MFIGRQIQAGVSLEATRGTAETTVEKWMKKVTADITSKTEKVQDDNTRGRLEKHDGGRVVQKWYEGTLEGILHADTIGFLLAQIYGDIESSNVAGSVYSHEFTLDQTVEHPTVTLFIHDSDVNKVRLNGGVVSSLEISATVDDYIRFSSNIIALDSASDTNTPSYDTEYDFIGKDVSIKVADTEVGLVEATALKVKNATITWDVENIRNHILGSYTADANYNAGFGISLKITKDYEDNTYKTLYEADTYKYVQVHIEGAADIGSGNNPSITLLLNRAQVIAWDRSGGADESVTEEIEFMGFYNATDTQASSVVLQNLTTEYNSAS